MSDMVPEVLNAALDSLFTPKEPGEQEYQGEDGLLAVLPKLPYAGAVQDKALGQRQDCSLPLQMPAGSDGGKETPG